MIERDGNSSHSYDGGNLHGKAGGGNVSGSGGGGGGAGGQQQQGAPASGGPTPTGGPGSHPPGGLDHQLAGGQLMPPIYNEDTIHKVILVGDSGVGKTSLLVQFDQGKFQSGSFSATVGIGFTNKIVTIDNKKVKLQIWDTAGQERFRSVTHAYYRDAQALLLLYDVTNQSSFDNIRAWLSEIRQYAEEDVIIMLLGNKVDKPNRVITKEQGEKLAKQYEVSFMETSAKTGQNVELSFMAVARALISKQLSASSNQTGSKFNLSEYIESNKEQKGWCCGGGGAT